MKQMILVKLGNNIKQQRLLKGYSQEELASLCHLHRTYIGGVERGDRNIGIVNLVKIAKALDIPPNMLLENIA